MQSCCFSATPSFLSNETYSTSTRAQTNLDFWSQTQGIGVQVDTNMQRTIHKPTCTPIYTPILVYLYYGKKVPSTYICPTITGSQVHQAPLWLCAMHGLKKVCLSRHLTKMVSPLDLGFNKPVLSRTTSMYDVHVYTYQGKCIASFAHADTISQLHDVTTSRVGLGSGLITSHKISLIPGFVNL